MTDTQDDQLTSLRAAIAPFAKFSEDSGWGKDVPPDVAASLVRSDLPFTVSDFVELSRTYRETAPAEETDLFDQHEIEAFKNLALEALDAREGKPVAWRWWLVKGVDHD